MRLLHPSDTPLPPSAAQVNVNIIPGSPMCKTWLYERSVVAPANLWLAQRALRGAPPL